MPNWDPQKVKPGFHSSECERFPVADLQSLSMLGQPGELPKERMKVVMKVHNRIASSWANGGMVSFFYKFDFLGDRPPVVEARHVLATLKRIADDRELPREIAGCSIDYLKDGKIWQESLQRFGDAIFMALSQGGAYSKAKREMSELEAKNLTTEYLQSLFAESPDSSLFFFGLDPGFSSWFYQVYWDFAFAMTNAHEQWLALVLATDTD